MKALEVKSLTFSYEKDITILDDVYFDILKGEYVSIVGHNGSGKSTLAKLLIGLLPFNKGEIKILGLELNKSNLFEIRNKVAIVFQNPDNQFIATTVEDDVAFGLENRCYSKTEMQESVLKVLKEVNMEEYLAKEPNNLSGGQKQRVALAGALATNPEILILDEATSMLDPRGRSEIRLLINKMKQNNPNLTVISITHDVEEAYLSDRVIVLNHGKIILNDKPEIVFKNKKTLESFNLTIPFVMEFKEKLKEAGFDIKENMSLEEVLTYLCQLK